MHGSTGATRLNERTDQLFDETGKKRGRRKNDYLETVRRIPRSEAFDLVAAGNDLGIGRLMPTPLAGIRLRTS
jgi:hypothetical protein